ncbi:hypothetical protein GCM10022247_56660 [Allokutzneria multivorans]|uniref:Uncharacterized protein n=1 Tax=Allokutzneria multivorans TaxID=1142134 RepID=A0ABP7TDV6_9PSEU
MRKLLDLRDAGWAFHRTEAEVRGVRTWPGGWADALAARYVSDAFAVRVDPDGAIVWRREGGLVDVVYELLMLPAPECRFASRLGLDNS